MLKPIVINTSDSPQGLRYKWNKLENVPAFISRITTQDVNIDDSNELSRLVSGIPTPFARAVMFKYAINSSRQNNDNLPGLMAFYKTLQNEWKGLIACFALDNQPITVDKILLKYSAANETNEVTNRYEPKGALGDMLFDDKALWCDQQALKAANQVADPFIYVIRYDGQVVGGTSPESLVFTAPSYQLNIRQCFYNERTKKFSDPLMAELTHEQAEKLYVYVNYLINGKSYIEEDIETTLGGLRQYLLGFHDQRPDTGQLLRFMGDWLAEIKAYADKKRYRIDANAIVPSLKKFGAPFDVLFNYNTKLYGRRGRISIENSPGSIEVELAELLLDPTTATVAEIIFNDPKDADRAGSHMMVATADGGNEKKYFTLPLSEKGLAIFQDEIDGLLTPGSAIKSNLLATYNSAKDELNVSLRVDVNNNITSFHVIYKEPLKIKGGQKVICWPDFVSIIWDQYFLYSELPHNDNDIKAIPLRADKTTFELLSEENNPSKFKKIALDGQVIDETAELLLEYDITRLGSADLKYEIYESKEPFKAIEVQGQSKSAGYLIFKNIRSMDPATLKDYRAKHDHLHLPGTRVGFDFGSNNTCISYLDKNNQPATITFNNRRRFLLGVDAAEGNSKMPPPTLPNKVFFFQNEPTQSNLIKSMIMIHNEMLIRDLAQGPVVKLAKEVNGGFPVFEKNIPVEQSDASSHITRFKNQPSTIKYNMKWSHIDKENAYRTSFLKLLWLKTYAELLTEDMYPAELVWAYPSSMNRRIVERYSLMWKEIARTNPLVTHRDYPREIYINANVARPDAEYDNNDVNALTESEAVCRYALFDSLLTPGPRGLLMGFDVGGSTTDILCVAQKKNAKGNVVNTLIKQSSIKLAAGKLSDATKKSRNFIEALTLYCKQEGLYIHGININPVRLNESTASFYYNMIVDRLKTEDELNGFYRHILTNCDELFVINAYITGLILFYAGQLAFKIKPKSDPEKSAYDEDFFDDVKIGVFGKGGRMFDWLKALNPGTAKKYYKECFKLGYGVKFDEIKEWDIFTPKAERVKAEVSYGLSRRNVLNTTGERVKELIGEDGYKYKGNSVDALDDINWEYLKNFGTDLVFPREFKRFSAFYKVFYDFTKDRFPWPFNDYQAKIDTMPIQAYIKNIPEYMLADEVVDFDFEAPIIILEGMCFLDEVLWNKIFKS